MCSFSEVKKLEFCLRKTTFYRVFALRTAQILVILVDNSEKSESEQLSQKTSKYKWLEKTVIKVFSAEGSPSKRQIVYFFGAAARISTNSLAIKVPSIPLWQSKGISHGGLTIRKPHYLESSAC